MESQRRFRQSMSSADWPSLAVSQFLFRSQVKTVTADPKLRGKHY